MVLAPRFPATGFVVGYNMGVVILCLWGCLIEFRCGCVDCVFVFPSCTLWLWLMVVWLFGC